MGPATHRAIHYYSSLRYTTLRGIRYYRWPDVFFKNSEKYSKLLLTFAFEKALEMGTHDVSPYFIPLMDIIAKIEQLLQPILEGTDMFIVKISIKPTNNVKVFLDADSGFSIAKSSSVNRALRNQIEALALFTDNDYSLEVSSPGIDEPLVLFRQYQKNIGRKIEVELQDNSKVMGKLLEVQDDLLSLEICKDPKKKLFETLQVPLNTIKQAIIQISF